MATCGHEKMRFDDACHVPEFNGDGKMIDAYQCNHNRHTLSMSSITSLRGMNGYRSSYDRICCALKELK